MFILQIMLHGISKNERLTLDNVKPILAPDDFGIVRTLTEPTERKRGFN